MVRNLWQDFKDFAFKGNMLDLAVAVVIGTAFGAVVNSLVTNIIMPAISYVQPSGEGYRPGNGAASRLARSSASWSHS